MTPAPARAVGIPGMVDADLICTAAQSVLEEHFPVWAQRAGVDPVREWTQLPAADALNTATLPAGAITSPGLVQPPRRTAPGRYNATWRLAVGVYVKGADYAQTQGRARVYGALVRSVLLAHPALGDLGATSLDWRGEEYAPRPNANNARTLGGCAVAFDVTVDDVVPHDFDPTTPEGPGGAPPTVRQTRSTITVRPSQTQQE